MSNSNPVTVLREFMRANKQSMIVMGDRLDRNKQEVTTQPPEEWEYVLFTLEDGRKFCLSNRHMDKMEALGYRPRWRM